MQKEQYITSQGPEEKPAKKNDADNGNENFYNETLENEKLIDPGNEHHHSDDTNVGSPSQHDADSEGKATSTTEPEPGEGKKDVPDTIGEDG